MKRLLVIRFSALGDVAILVPVLRLVAEQYPDWEITMVSRCQCEPLFRDMPGNVRFVGADLKGKHHGRRGLDRLLSEIDYRHFDAVADMHKVLRSAYLALRVMLCGARLTWIHKAHLSKWLMVHKLMPTRHSLVTTTKRYQHAFNRLGFDVHIPPTFLITSAQGQGKLKEQDTRQGIGIAPFAAHKGKIYPTEQMEEVVRMLSNRASMHDMKIYLFGAGKQEEQVLDQWAARYEHVVSLAGKQDMAADIETMSRLKLMVTMDSANMHLASLAGTRVVSIWGATHPSLGFLGYGQRSRDCIQRQDLDCRPCSVFGKQPCRYGDYRCFDIAPKDIVERIMGAYTE